MGYVAMKTKQIKMQVAKDLDADADNWKDKRRKEAEDWKPKDSVECLPNNEGPENTSEPERTPEDISGYVQETLNGAVGNVQDTAKAVLNADVFSGLANYGQQVVSGNANWVGPTSE